MERYRLPIPWDAVPTEHRPPYRRIDPAVPQGYPKVIQHFEVDKGAREPDPRKYKKYVVQSIDGSDLTYWELKKEYH